MKKSALSQAGFLFYSLSSFWCFVRPAYISPQFLCVLTKRVIRPCSSGCCIPLSR